MKPPIRSKDDLLLFLKQHVDDAGIVHIVADVMEYTGRDGYIQTQRGGDGTPYRIEYRELSNVDNIPTREFLSRVAKLKEVQTHTVSETEKEELKRQIAELTGGLATIWINVDSEEEFRLKSKKLLDAYRSAKEHSLP